MVCHLWLQPVDVAVDPTPDVRCSHCFCAVCYTRSYAAMPCACSTILCHVLCHAVCRAVCHGAGDVVSLGDGRLPDGHVRDFYLKEGQTVRTVVYLRMHITRGWLLHWQCNRACLLCNLQAAATKQLLEAEPPGVC